MQETQVQSLGYEDPLEGDMTTRSSILAWEIPWTERILAGYSLWGRIELDTTEHTCTHQTSVQGSLTCLSWRLILCDLTGLIAYPTWNLGSELVTVQSTPVL